MRLTKNRNAPDCFEYRIIRMIGAFACCLLLSSCADRALYSEAGKSFSDGYDKAIGIINDYMESTTKSKRVLGVVYYLQNGNDVANLDSRDIDESFGRFACAGVGDYRSQQAAVALITSYKSMIAEISKAPSDDLGELWDSINKNRKKIPPLEVDAGDQKSYDKCLKKVKALLKDPLTIKGDVLAPSEFEAFQLFVYFEVLDKLLDALKKVLVTGLTAADEAVRARALRQFVKENQELIDAALTNRLDDRFFKVMFHRQQITAIVLPRAEFAALFRLNRQSQKEEIIKLSYRIHANLANFDVLRLAHEPENVTKAMREAHDRLKDLADGKISVKEAWASLKAFADLLSNFTDALEAAKKQRKDTSDSF